MIQPDQPVRLRYFFFVCDSKLHSLWLWHTRARAHAHTHKHHRHVKDVQCLPSGKKQKQIRAGRLKIVKVLLSKILATMSESRFLCYYRFRISSRKQWLKTNQKEFLKKATAPLRHCWHLILLPASILQTTSSRKITEKQVSVSQKVALLISISDTVKIQRDNSWGGNRHGSRCSLTVWIQMLKLTNSNTNLLKQKQFSGTLLPLCT